MSQSYRVAVVVGSLRKESLNRKLALALIGLAPEDLRLELVEIGQLPLYNADDESKPPLPVVDFRASIARADALLFVTPEYNRSVPGVLKNAVDIGSRPPGQNVWAGKPGAVISLSPGAIGGFGANHHLRQSLMCLDVPLLQQPEAYIGGGGALFDELGAITKPETQAFLSRFMTAFSQWIARNSKE